MKSSTERESSMHYRAALICFICIALCVYLDVQKYIRTGAFSFDLNFLISVLLYFVLLFLGIHSLRKGKKKRREQDE